jgi:hypothetical protein
MIEAIKDIIRGATGIPDEALHVLLGLTVYFLCVLIFRVPLRSWWPWLAVLALQLINEASDAIGDLPRRNGIEVRGTILDTAITLLLPTIIVLIAKLAFMRAQRLAPR